MVVPAFEETGFAVQCGAGAVRLSHHIRSRIPCLYFALLSLPSLAAPILGSRAARKS
jgi:hypothetical protein